MTRDDLRERLEELEQRFPNRAERELSDVEKHLIRAAASGRRDSGYDIDSLNEAVSELLEEALKGASADDVNDLTTADVDAAAERLGFDQWLEDGGGST